MMFFIIGFSNQNGSESSGLSLMVCRWVIEASDHVLNFNFAPEEAEKVIESIDYPVRKLAHMTEYAILCGTLLLHFSVLNVKIKRRIAYSLIIVFLFASTDEIHQLFIPGRSGQFRDVCIDTAGGIIAAGVYFLFSQKARLSRKDRQRIECTNNK